LRHLQQESRTARQPVESVEREKSSSNIFATRGEEKKEGKSGIKGWFSKT
jgi:hypothetical protein